MRRWLWCGPGGQHALDERRYPAAMRKLPPVVRNKVIEIANALLAEGMEEGLAIRIAITKGKRWAEHHGGRTP